MSERGARRGAGAPFYAPLRRKTSAEIISEARAAIYGEMSGMSNGDGGAAGALRPLRTRRPYTPREPQRTLFTDRTRKKDNRPPSSYDLKFLSLSESGEETLEAMDARLANLDEESLNEMLMETLYTKKKPLGRASQRLQVPERSSEGWSGFTKLPHLSGRSKPLHRRHTTGQAHGDNLKPEVGLAQAICVIRPLGDYDVDDGNVNTVSPSPDHGTSRSQYTVSKSMSCDSASGGTCNDISVKQLAVQLPNTTISNDHIDNLSILELSEALSQRCRDTARTLQLLEALTRAVGVSAPSGSLRELVLRALFVHADHHDDAVLVAVARALLTMRVTGPNLAAACKIVFKIAKDDKNDHFFRNTNLLELVVEGCGRAEPVSESACCVYGCAALRVLALEPRLAARATCAGAVHLAALHLKILNTAKAENPRTLNEQCTHALFQVTGALRSLATVVDTHAQEFIASGALPELVAALGLHTDRDVLTNVARCLSVVSGSAACCASLCACAGAARALVRALAACASRAPLAVRLAYTLGNMAADHDQARDDIYNEEGSIDVLLTILESYTKRSPQGSRDLDSDPDLHVIGTDLGGSDGSDEDVLIKTVRVVANLCLSERAGRGLAAGHAERMVKALLACLKHAEKIDHEKMSPVESANSIEHHEELATAALATLNNLTFYREPSDPPDPLHVYFDDICKVTCRWVRLRGVSSAASCEAVRALGNMSRAARTAQLIVLHGALDTLDPFLHHESDTVRCAAAGVLVNVCGAGAACGEAAALAARALCACAARADAPPAPLLARALWNAHAHSPHPLDAARAHDVANALARFIDDESVFVACEVSKTGERRDSMSRLAKLHVTFEEDSDKSSGESDPGYDKDKWETDGGGSDLGFEEGSDAPDEAAECCCRACRRLAQWDELVAVALPLMERMRPPRHDAAVGTD
ncbi:unnamed protein product [Arctia plantaginis]|uniref:Armadillo repeat-containing protein 2 n=1 Tax=Arctia plantaginis TaxID=874455 RepID=A0A8S0YMG3_ARCPL|nr:unnamed protein product [Arctia plantaginis]